jgi:acyl-CoA oxidase
VVAEVNALCKELRPHARTLVDAFAIPEQYVVTPLG